LTAEVARITDGGGSWNIGAAAIVEFATLMNAAYLAKGGELWPNDRRVLHQGSQAQAGKPNRIGRALTDVGKRVTMTARRDGPFGLKHSLTWVDRLGIWLSTRRIRSAVPDFAGLRVADIGCGYHALFARSVLDQVESMILVDLALAESLKQNPRVTAIQGELPECMAAIEDRSLDVVICNSVIEHLAEPLETLIHVDRICAPGGLVLLNVPSWRGKFFLELAAFRLGLSPAAEMDDHKMYYDPKDLWPLLVRSGFRPKNIRVFKHKFGLNTFAICRKSAMVSD